MNANERKLDEVTPVRLRSWSAGAGGLRAPYQRLGP